jgi:hypothetical protein
MISSKVRAPVPCKSSAVVSLGKVVGLGKARSCCGASNGKRGSCSAQKAGGAS